MGNRINIANTIGMLLDLIHPVCSIGFDCLTVMLYVYVED